MQRQEIPNNTREQVRDYLLDALALTDELEPPAELREAVFAQAVQLLAGKQVVLTQPAPVLFGDMAIPGSRRR